MNFLQLPVPPGTPLRQIMESFIKALVRLGYKKESIESELYWLMEERRRGQQLSSKQRAKIDYERGIQGHSAEDDGGAEAVYPDEGPGAGDGDYRPDGGEDSEAR